MASYDYVQLFLFGLLCIGAASAETSSPTIRALTDFDINKVYGDWFLGKMCGPDNNTLDKSACFRMSIKKINETNLQIVITTTPPERPETINIDISENAGTWRYVDGNRISQVIYLSEDGSAMELATGIKDQTVPGLLLLSKQLPLSPEKKAEVLHAEEIAGVPEHIHFSKWESEATCPST
ncbi:uncharacterized protein [Anabrus simplex]|uniref:uncharacterized protein n=1 Tax=Anabrus simplex TaxID=316456 RepID=UPI0035A2B26A